MSTALRELAALRRELTTFSHRVHAAGWVANHDGNLSLRLPPDRLLCTPTSVSKADVSEEQILLLDAQGAVLEGKGKPFSELVLHQTVYAARADVSCVLHAHPRYATALSLLEAEVQRPYMAEFVVSLGADLPIVPYHLPGTKAYSESLIEPIRRSNALILANHGVLTCGQDLAQAYYRMELLEHYAAILCLARSLGTPKPLPESDTASLLDKRRKAGLEPPTASSSAPAPATQPVRGDLRALIEEEVLQALAARTGR